MQIHEITYLNKQKVLEGLLDQWSARFGAASKDPAMASMTPDQRVKAIQNDAALNKIGDAAWDAWVAKWYQIGAAKKGRVDQQMFIDELRNYVASNLLPRYQDYNSLSNKQDIENNLRAVTNMYMGGKPEQAKKYFDQVVDLSAIARTVAPQTTGTAKTAQQKQAQPRINATQAQADVERFMQGVGVQKQQAVTIAQGLQQLNAGQALVSGSTRNPVADALLTYLGFRVQ